MSEQGSASLRVMVVDDHPIWREAIERDLRAAGFEVTSMPVIGRPRTLGCGRVTGFARSGFALASAASSFS